ncbi:beta-propeller fold lactonase family protein [Paenibacillus aurantiacus]|uniref:Beta-propeller fold lactonase family protein n=1 Tax=Paenibacillus aurantiacus TaxID=1936118 RepID=A0ABV5KK84_9BACL
MTSGPLHIPQRPIAAVYSPDSILQLAVPPIPPVSVGSRTRIATCADVGWFHHNRRLAVLNLGAEALHVYVFDPAVRSLSLAQTLSNRDGMQFYWPEQLSFSNNGRWLAITNSKNDQSSINLYAIDPFTQLVLPEPLLVIRHPHAVFHGVTFSPCSAYVVSATMDAAGQLLIYKLQTEADGSLQAVLTQAIMNRYPPLKPKSAAFSADSSLIAICYSANGGAAQTHDYGTIAVYAFDPNTGTIRHEQPLSELTDRPELAYNDAIGFTHDAEASYLAVQSQSNDCVIFYAFDRASRQIDPHYLALGNPAAQLSFPHGLSWSTDDRFLAVSNNGDDKVTIYAMTPDS